LRFVQGNGSIGLCHVANRHLRTRRESADEQADGVESTPRAREVIRVNEGVDGWVGVSMRWGVREREVLNISKFSWPARFWNDGKRR
jgi:hypothetical protein